MRTRPFGAQDALSQAQEAARVKLNEEAGGYALPNAARTRSEAIMALVLLLRSAAREDTKNANYYKGQANEAAYKYRDAPIWNILATAVGVTKGAPRTNQVAKAVEKASTTKASTPTRKPKRRASETTEAEVYAPPADVPSWTDQVPSWAPIAAAAVGVGALLYTLWPRRGAQGAA